MKLLHFSGINRPFVFILPDKHGSPEVEFKKLNFLAGLGCKDVFLEGVVGNSDFRSGEIFLSRYLLEAGFNVLPIEDQKLHTLSVLALDIFYILAFKFHNLFLTLDCFEDDMVMNVKFLSLHESMDELLRLAKINFNYDFDLKDLNPRKAEFLLQDYANKVLNDLLMVKRNDAFVKNLQDFSFRSCALVVGKEHVDDLKNKLVSYNLLSL